MKHCSGEVNTQENRKRWELIGLIQIRWSGKAVLNKCMKPRIKLHEYLGEEYISHSNGECKGPVVGKNFIGEFVKMPGQS